ncbi:MAG TPA: MFS transporter [Candidatus Micrarchaeaceae archaeon]|nr:MFS transporter [Candidatus Micrarchaeaceae archaeon]
MLGGNRLWRHADFLKLWAGQTISVIGSQVTVLALPTIAILQLHATAAEVGLLAAAQQVAFPVLALFAGVFADRLRRRPMMIAADGVRGLAILSVPVAAGFGALSLVQLYVVALVLGVGTVLFDISYLAYVPSLVTRDELLEANTKLEVTFSASSLVGPSLGGVLIQLIGAAQAMFADAVSFVVSVLSIIWIRQAEESPRHSTAPRPGVLAEIGEGLRLVLHHPILRALLLMLTIGGLGFHLQDPALFLFVYRNVDLSPGLVGLVFGAGGAGALVGALVVGTVVRRLGVGNSLALTNVLVGLAFLAWPLALFGSPVLILGGLMFFAGICDSIYNVSQVSLRQSVTPSRLQGRMTATMRTVFWGVKPVANVGGGVLAGAFGAPATIVIGSVIGMTATIAVLAGPLGRVRQHADIAQPLETRNPEPHGPEI